MNLFPLLLVMPLFPCLSASSTAMGTGSGETADMQTFFILQGSGGFTLDGLTYRHFSFHIYCKTGDDCTGSSIDIGSIHVPVTTVSYRVSGGSGSILVESRSLQCSLFDLGATREGERVVFDCVSPFGSGISTDSYLHEFLQAP